MERGSLCNFASACVCARMHTSRDTPGSQTTSDCRRYRGGGAAGMNKESVTVTRRTDLLTREAGGGGAGARRTRRSSRLALPKELLRPGGLLRCPGEGPGTRQECQGTSYHGRRRPPPSLVPWAAPRVSGGSAGAPVSDFPCHLAEVASCICGRLPSPPLAAARPSAAAPLPRNPPLRAAVCVPV